LKIPIEQRGSNKNKEKEARRILEAIALMKDYFVAFADIRTNEIYYALVKALK
jgi:hypothetical protein